MSKLSLIDSACRIKQAQQVLSLWLEAPIKKDSGTDHLIGAVITLLDGIPELMDSVEGELVYGFESGRQSMSNVEKFTPGNDDVLRAEATPHGVNIMTRNDAGGFELVALISYESAVNGLDAGEYDDKPDIGYAIHFAVADGGARGWFDFTAQHNVTMWRWLIAATFISEMKRENGTTTIKEDDGKSSLVTFYSNGTEGIVVYPFAERLAMANNMEGAMIERYGIEQGTANAIVFYQAMIDTERGELTPFGRQTLAELHDGFIADLNENGLPEMPAAH